jgi:hypothetical protein
MGVVGLYWEENIVFCPVRDSMLVENGVYFHRRPSRQGRNVEKNQPNHILSLTGQKVFKN